LIGAPPRPGNRPRWCRWWCPARAVIRLVRAQGQRRNACPRYCNVFHVVLPVRPARLGSGNVKHCGQTGVTRPGPSTTARTALGQPAATKQLWPWRETDALRDDKPTFFKQRRQGPQQGHPDHELFSTWRTTCAAPRSPVSRAALHISKHAPALTESTEQRVVRVGRPARGKGAW